MLLALTNGAALMENYIGNVTPKKEGEKRMAALESERVWPPLSIVADVQLGEWRGLMRASLISFTLPVPD